MLTVICQAGMKSALCRTLSKIFCSWGLMKELSEEKKREVVRKKKTFTPQRSSAIARTSEHYFVVMPLLKCVP